MLKRKYYESLDTLKIIAIILVFNSHCDELYPISSFATGGAIGNSLFFIVSGYLLNININRGFFKFYYNKILRIYPSMLIVSIIYMFVWDRYPTTLRVFRFWFIWPTMFWFGGALVVFYPIIYFLKKIKFEFHYKFYTIMMLTLYFILYLIIVDKSTWSVEAGGLISIQGWFKCIHYFYLFSLGYYIKNTKLLDEIKWKSPNLFIVSGVLFIFQILVKYGMSRCSVLYYFQFITQFIDIAISVFLLVGFVTINDQYKKIIPNQIMQIVKMFSQLSFEIYLLQFLFIDLVTNVLFPVNVVLAITLTITCSVPLRFVNNLITDKLRR